MRAWPASSTVDRSAAFRLGFTTLPVVTLANPLGSPVYGECLARLLIGDSIILSPGEFVEHFEAEGVIAALDTAMTKMVLDALEKDPRAILGCNVSPYSIADEEAWEGLLDVLRARPALTKRLYLEITESFPIDEIEGGAERLAEAKRCGCKLVVDDFGAGFATSDYLHGVDVDWDAVKIDKSCFGPAGDAQREAQALRSQIALAAALAPIVVVEGIETQRHLDIAISAGAAHGQGWLFGDPAPDHWTILDDRMQHYCAEALMVRNPRRDHRSGAALRSASA